MPRDTEPNEPRAIPAAGPATRDALSLPAGVVMVRKIGSPPEGTMVQAGEPCGGLGLVRTGWLYSAAVADAAMLCDGSPNTFEPARPEDARTIDEYRQQQKKSG